MDYAIVQRGSSTLILPYTAERHYHVFELDGLRHFVRQAEGVDAVEVHDYTSLFRHLSLSRAPWRRVRQEAEMMALGRSGLRLRYFAQVGNAYLELPMQHYLRGWGKYVNRVHSLIVRRNEVGHASVNTGGAQLLKRELTAAGIPDADIAVFVESIVQLANVGHAADMLIPEVARRWQPLIEQPAAILPIVFLSAYIGLQLGTGLLGDVYRGMDHQWDVWLILIPTLAFVLARRFKG